MVPPNTDRRTVDRNLHTHVGTKSLALPPDVNPAQERHRPDIVARQAIGEGQAQGRAADGQRGKGDDDQNNIPRHKPKTHAVSSRSCASPGS